MSSSCAGTKSEMYRPSKASKAETYSEGEGRYLQDFFLGSCGGFWFTYTHKVAYMFFDLFIFYYVYGPSWTGGRD